MLSKNLLEKIQPSKVETIDQTGENELRFLLRSGEWISLEVEHLGHGIYGFVGREIDPYFEVLSREDDS